MNTNLKVSIVAMATAILASAGQAQISPPQQTAKEQPAASKAGSLARLVLLGTGGGPIVRVKRSQPSNLLVINGTVYLIDVGVGTLGRLAAAGYQPAEVDQVFITHHHLDHDGGLADLMAFSCVTGRNKRVTVTGPYGTDDMVKAARAYLKVPLRTFTEQRISPGCDPETAFASTTVSAPGKVFSDSNVTVYAAENTHYSQFPAGSNTADKSYSYRFDTVAGSIVFSGDTGPSSAVAALAKGADVLVIEVIDEDATMTALLNKNKMLSSNPAQAAALREHMAKEHLAPEEIGKMAAAAGVKAVVLTHAVPGLDDEVTAAAYVKGIDTYFHGSVYAGRDLDEFFLPQFQRQAR